MAHQEPQETAAGGARRARSARLLRLAVLTAVAAMTLSACTGNVTTPGEALRILGTTLPAAYVAEPYDQSVQAVGGLRPYTFKLAEGALPPGLQLQGGAIRGTPGKTGSYSFTVQVSDANLSTTVQQYTLTVTQVPPPTLDLNAPDTQVDRPVTLRVQVDNARKLEGLRTQVRWDPSSFELVPDSVRASRQGLAMLDQASKGQLQVAVVPLGTRLDGKVDLFTFQLEPVAGAAYLTVTAQTEYISAGGHAFNRTASNNAGKSGTTSRSTTSGSSSGSSSGGSAPGALTGKNGGTP